MLKLYRICQFCLCDFNLMFDLLGLLLVDLKRDKWLKLPLKVW